MYPINLSGKSGIIFGVANHRSIAWGIAEILHQAGMKLAIAYQNERVKERVSELVEKWDDDTTLIECDVSDEEHVKTTFKNAEKSLGKLAPIVHSIAFANREDLGGRFVDTPREGFTTALDISAYSLISIAKHGSRIMSDGGNIITLTFNASNQVFPGYNVMGTAKAALENIVRQLASDLGPDNIRVNAVSAGPLDTLSSRVISHYRVMKTAHAERAPMRRNITPEEVSKAALFLCSDLSSGITGEILHVDTGYNIMGI